MNGRDKTDTLEAMEGLNSMICRAANLRSELESMYAIKNSSSLIQDNIEAEFAIAMDGLLKEGYWNDPKYAVGQEEYLYADALDMMEMMSKPTITYSVSLVS